MDVGKECVRGEAHLSKGLVSVPQIASDDKVESCGCGCSSLSLSLCLFLGVGKQIMEPPKKCPLIGWETCELINGLAEF